MALPRSSAELYAAARGARGKRKIGQDIVARFIAAGSRGCEFNFALERATTVRFLLPRIFHMYTVK